MKEKVFLMIKDLLKTLDKRIIGYFGTIIVTGLSLFLYFFLKSASPTMSLLFSNVDSTDSAKIIDCLKAMSVSFDTKDNGSQIMISEKKIAEVRMLLAEKGLPSGGVVGYELFDKKDFFGTSSNIVDVNYARALEGELSRSIKTINQIQSARVHLVFPRRGLFAAENEKPSASIMIKMLKDEKLNLGQIAAIRHLAASAVSNLSVENIAIVDNDGSLLAKGQDELEGASVVFQQDVRIAYENHLSKTIENLLEKSLGVGKIKAKVTADLDFDKVSSTTTQYDPNGKVERNVQTNEENDTRQNDGNKPVSIQSALPNQQNQSNNTNNQSKNSQETINYEISNTKKTYVKEGWTLKRLSVAVILDGSYVFDKKKKTDVYKKRSTQEIKQMTDLIKTAIGYDEKRGDNVRVLNVQFSCEKKQEERNLVQKILNPKDDEKIVDVFLDLLIGFMKFITSFLYQDTFMTILAVILSFFCIIKPLTLKLFEPVKVDENLEKSAKKISEIMSSEPAYDEDGYLEPQSKASQIDLTDIDSCIKGSSLKKITELIQNHPDEAICILRNWIYLDKK